jgi:hypothetical protein
MAVCFDSIWLEDEVLVRVPDPRAANPSVFRPDFPRNFENLPES